MAERRRGTIEIFCLLLVAQLAGQAVAYYLNSDVERVLVSGSPQSRERQIKEAAVRRGMDGDAIEELLRTRQPVVRTTTEPNGVTKTTTYRLEPDGSISRNTVMQMKSVHYNELPTSSFFDTDDDKTSVRRTETRTYTGPAGERRVTHTWTSQPKWHHEDGSADSWPHFKSHEWSTSDKKPEQPTVETTSQKPLDSWTPKTWSWSDNNVPKLVPADTVPRSAFDYELSTRQPLRSLDDFLQTPYQPTTATPSTVIGQPPRVDQQPVTTIKLEDLPVTEVLSNGKPVSETFLRTLPPELRPQTTDATAATSNIYQVENIAPTVIEAPGPTVETSIRRLTKTVYTPNKPSVEDLDENMREILRKAGINSSDIESMTGDTLTKTRTEPDGRVITTTYTVRTVPSPTTVEDPRFAPTTTSHTRTTEITRDYTTVPRPSEETRRTVSEVAGPRLVPRMKDDPVREFLSRVGLTVGDLQARHGQLEKRFVNDEGQVLTVTFVLSSPIGLERQKEPYKPLK